MKALSILILSAIFLSACGTSPGTVAGADNKGRGDRTTNPTRQVQVTTAEEKALDQLVVVTGTLAADQEVVLGFKVSGRLAEIPVDLGSSVQKGQQSAKLDTTDFELRVRQADAALQQARVRLGLSPEDSDFSVKIENTAVAKQARAEMDAARNRMDRARQLMEKGLLPKADFDTTNSGYKVAEAKYEDALEEVRDRQALLAQRRSEFEIARQQLADSVLYAPIDGMLPLALGTGPGAEERRAVAVAVIGGQSLSLLLTLLMCPVAYSLIDDLTEWMRTRAKGAVAERPVKSSM